MKNVFGPRYNRENLKALFQNDVIDALKWSNAGESNVQGDIDKTQVFYYDLIVKSTFSKHSELEWSIELNLRLAYFHEYHSMLC